MSNKGFASAWTVSVVQVRDFRSLVDRLQNALCLKMMDRAIQNRVGSLRCVANRLLTKTGSGKSVQVTEPDSSDTLTHMETLVSLSYVL